VKLALRHTGFAYFFALSRAGAAALLVLALGACHNDTAKPKQPPPPQVSVVTVAPKDIPVTWQFVGRTQGFRDVQVRARVTGILLKRAYTEGGFVKKGTLLFQIDPAQFKAMLDQQQGVVAQAEATLANANRNVARLKPLFNAHAVSRKDLDDALSAQAVAKANLESARAQLQQAQLNLDYTRVVAPISGLTGKANQSEGSLVTAEQTSPLTTISQTDPIYVYFSFADNDYLNIRNEVAAKQMAFPPDGNFDVTLELGDGSTYAAHGRIDFRDYRIDPNTGTIQARAEFPNPDGQLVPNQFVRVIVNGAQYPHAIAVPQRAVLQGQGGQFVYVVDKDGKAERRPVKAGTWIGTDWMINDGLAAGDRVIVDGVQKVRPGAAVSIAPAQAPPAGGTAGNAAAAAK
jgi:membrane fusion protein (multidrug efflux system)